MKQVHIDALCAFLVTTYLIGFKDLIEISSILFLGGIPDRCCL